MALRKRAASEKFRRGSGGREARRCASQCRRPNEGEKKSGGGRGFRNKAEVRDVCPVETEEKKGEDMISQLALAAGGAGSWALADSDVPRLILVVVVIKFVGVMNGIKRLKKKGVNVVILQIMVHEINLIAPQNQNLSTYHWIVVPSNHCGVLEHLSHCVEINLILDKDAIGFKEKC